MPNTNWSFYLNTTNTNTIYQLGCNQGSADAADHNNSFVILDFGAQDNANSGTYFPGVKINSPTQPSSASYATDENLAEVFAWGYYKCASNNSDTTTTLFLVVGTNNSGYSVNYGGGQGWGNVVSAVGSYISNNSAEADQVVVYGGNDIESWGSASGTLAWTAGYQANAPGYSYVDHGSADGCPTTISSPPGSCSNNWNQYDYWYVSWGNNIGEAAPEIYNTSGDQATQWALISAYGANNENNYIAAFESVLDEYDLNSGTNSSAQAWTDLWNALTFWNVVPVGIAFSSQMHRE
jgi:hypothetical protein